MRLEGQKSTKSSKFTNVQKVLILKQGIDGVPVAEIRGWARNNLARYFNWKEKNAGLMPDDMRLDTSKNLPNPAVS